VSIIQLSELLENYNLQHQGYELSSIIQLSELLENYNEGWHPASTKLIIQLSELLENYNSQDVYLPHFGIIQLSELLENYNEKSAHHWAGNFSLQILTDLHSSKISSHGEFPVFCTSTNSWIGRYNM